MKRILIFILVFSFAYATQGQTAGSVPEKKMLTIKSGEYIPFFRLPGTDPVFIKSFLLDETAVTNAEFLEFVKANPQWRRSKVSRLMADTNYLKYWKSDLEIGEHNKELYNSPVVYISWFAAKAYAQWKGKRLPTVAEWEYAGMAPLVNSREGTLTSYVLNWYSKPNPKVLPNVRSTYRNKYGLYDMHGLIWEWTFDFNSFIKSGDSRANTEDELKLFCASSTLYVNNKSDYASFLRFSYRGSLKGNFCIANLGFRCAKDIN
ncbi:MAG: formylglycine-generating enzyme family protein [Chitinophagaceae bacterium]|nr:formylglycine-generating enzyme family protein [Chitinophagaceae bacterium]